LYPKDHFPPEEAKGPSHEGNVVSAQICEPKGRTVHGGNYLGRFKIYFEEEKMISGASC